MTKIREMMLCVSTRWHSSLTFGRVVGRLMQFNFQVYVIRPVCWIQYRMLYFKYERVRIEKMMVGSSRSLIYNHEYRNETYRRLLSEKEIKERIRSCRFTHDFMFYGWLKRNWALATNGPARFKIKTSPWSNSYY